jgi:hypothetical protein
MRPIVIGETEEVRMSGLTRIVLVAAAVMVAAVAAGAPVAAMLAIAALVLCPLLMVVVIHGMSVHGDGEASHVRH